MMKRIFGLAAFSAPNTEMQDATRARPKTVNRAQRKEAGLLNHETGLN
jgi:hypothetical protein